MSSGFGESTKSASSCSDKSSNKDADFECHICFDSVRDPVVTLCGHLFCWPCLYMWLHHRSCSKGCPVCKALVEEDKLVPLYGKGRSVTNPRMKSSYLGMEIPRRPLGQRPQTVEEEEELVEEEEDEDEEELEDPDYVDNPTLLVRLEEMRLSRDSTEQLFKEYRESTEQRFNEYTEFLNEYKEFRDEYKELRDEYKELRMAAESRLEQIEQQIKDLTECHAEEEQRIMECHAEAEQRIKECRAEAEQHIKECRAEAEQWIKECRAEAEQLIKECRAVHADEEQRFRSINS